MVFIHKLRTVLEKQDVGFLNGFPFCNHELFTIDINHDIGGRNT